MPAAEHEDDAPAPQTEPFEGVPQQLRNALERRGFTSLTAVQQAVVESASSDRDLRISSQTGSGKTVALGIALGRAFLEGEPLPKSLDGPRALIIAPTRELATQVADELGWLLADVPRVRVEVVVGGTDMRSDYRMLRNPPAILVGTPGRMLDHIRGEALSCADVTTVALDEADRMLDMGFREELEAIIDALPESRRSHLVSATFSGAVRGIADRFQSDALRLEGTQLGRANADIEHVVQLLDYGERYGALVNALLLTLGEQVLVFVDKRVGAAELAEKLSEDGFAALPFSGDLSQAQRTRTLGAFRSGTIQVLVCTDVAARGIDVPDIALVVHMTPPQDPDDYTHRSGRTGRAGKQGRSLLLVPPRAQHFVRKLLSAARVEATWEAVPTPSKVRKTITKDLRRNLHARMDSGEEIDEKTLAYAKNVLEKRDPVQLVATLLKMSEPRLPREPISVRPIEAEAEREDDGRGTGRRWGHKGPRRAHPGKRKFYKRKPRD